MADMNLLQASINGKLGAMYGARYKKARTLKIIPFSHAPHNQAQTRAVRAFEKLNRYASGIAKAFFPYLGLSSRGLLKHNAVAKWLAPCVAGGRFSIEATSQVIPADGSCEISRFDVDRNQGIVTLEASTAIAPAPSGASAWLVLIHDSNGKVVYSALPAGMDFRASVKLDLDPRFSYGAVVFRADRANRKMHVHGFDFAGGSLVIGRRVQIDLFSTRSNYSVQNGRLVINDDSVVVRGRRVVATV